MAESSWVSSVRSNVWKKVLFGVVIAIIVGGIVIRNNPSLFVKPHPKATSDVVSIPHHAEEHAGHSAVDPAEDSAFAVDAGELPHVDDVAGESAVHNDTLVSKAYLSVPISSIHAQMANFPQFEVDMSINIMCGTEQLRDEALLKRDELRLLVLRVIKNKQLDDVVTATLRPELLKEFNKLMTKGRIADIEFTGFDIKKKVQ